jgi:hypothetical protein
MCYICGKQESEFVVYRDDEMLFFYYPHKTYLLCKKCAVLERLTNSTYTMYKIRSIRNVEEHSKWIRKAVVYVIIENRKHVKKLIRAWGIDVRK